MPELQGTETEKNLLKAFAGESQARNRYTYAASVARKAGYLQIARLFEETADNEMAHAKVFFKFLERGSALEITASYPAGKIGDTAEALLAAAEGENEEWTDIYPTMAAKAKEEGFPLVAAAYTMISRVEKEHEARYRKLLERVKADEVFKRAEAIRWKCANCGYIHEGNEPPKMCPACAHPQPHFAQAEANY